MNRKQKVIKSGKPKAGSLGEKSIKLTNLDYENQREDTNYQKQE